MNRILRPSMILSFLFYLLQIVCVAALVYYLTRSIALLELDGIHDGIILKPALDVLSGKMLFRDTFTQYGAFLTLIHAWLLQAFGPYLYVLRLATVWVYVLTAVLMWILWKQFMPSIFASLTVVVWILLAGFYDKLQNWGVLLAWSTVFTFPFTIAGALFIVLWIRRNHSFLLFIAGVLLAFPFWIRQNIGAYLLFAFTSFILIARWKKAPLQNIKWFYIGASVVHAGFIIWLVSNGALGNWFADSIVFAYQWQKAVSYADRFPFFLIGSLLPVSFSAVSVWVLLPASGLLQGAVLLSKKTLKKTHLPLLWMVCLTVWSWFQYYPMRDAQHTFWAITPVVGMYIYTAVYPPVFKKYRILFFVIACILLIPDTFLRARMWKHKTQRFTYYEITQLPLLKYIRVEKNEYVYYSSLLKTIQRYEKKYPDIFIFSGTPNALSGVLTKRRESCSRYPTDWKWEIFSPEINAIYRRQVADCVSKYRPLMMSIQGYEHPSDYIRVTPVFFDRDYLLVPREKYLKPAR